ncbi:ABC transporter ATP-binding protein [Humidisolicoccus flavus]|uniref:ABC transporter ATP-binding protein n=1 Tax=Humidisolicoccus flavus TaxID=3111414 RepID=UPI003D2FD826
MSDQDDFEDQVPEARTPSKVPFSQLTDEEKRERRREAAKKAAATRARKKAEAALAAAEAESAENSEAVQAEVESASISLEQASNDESTDASLESTQAPSGLPLEPPASPAYDVPSDFTGLDAVVAAADESAIGSDADESSSDHVQDQAALHDESSVHNEFPEHAAQESSSDSAEPTALLILDALVKKFGATTAVDHVSIAVEPGQFYGIVGPNGAGKTTTLSMATGLLQPDAGRVIVRGVDMWSDGPTAKRLIGVLPDRLRLFERLTGQQMLFQSGVLRGLDAETVRRRSADLIASFDLEEAAGRVVADYSAGMTKKLALACALIHAPRLLVLDEPFESVDPVSTATILQILSAFVAVGGAVVLSSHSMDLVQRTCDHVAIIVEGRVLANGSMEDVRNGQTLEERFVNLAGGRRETRGMEWLHSYSV